MTGHVADDFAAIKAKMNPAVYLHPCIGEVPANSSTPKGKPNATAAMMSEELRNNHLATCRTLLAFLYDHDLSRLLLNGYLRGYVEWFGFKCEWSEDIKRFTVTDPDGTIYRKDV